MARILVVEDNETSLELIVYLLETFGHTLLTARDGLEGLEVARRETLDLALIDVHMPKMDGYELVRQIKSDPTLQTIPLVAITALAMVGDQDKALAAGFDGYIAKPIDPETLIAEVERYLATHRQVGTNTATILVVDDYPANREFLVTLLSYGGHRLLEATDGVEALALVRAEHPDLVIADIVMPTMDGYEFVRQIRADPDIAPTKVMFYTATYLKQEVEALAQSCGVSHILVKPSEPAEILQAVQEALGLATPPPPPPPLETFDREHLHLLTDKLSQQTNLLTAANERLAALIELSQQLVLEHDPHRILEKFCLAAREIIGAKYAAIGVLDNGGPNLRHFLTSGLDSQTATRIGYPPTGYGLLSQLLTEGRPLRLHNLGGDPEAIGLTSTAGAPYHPLIHSFLGATIASPTRLYGWLYLGDKIGTNEFSQEDERIITTLSAQVAVAYENGNRYYEIQRHAAKLEQEVAERKNLQEQLLQVQKMDAIGQLAGGVAHDFNNLLVVITGYSELLLQDISEQDSMRPYLEEIKKASERAATLTRQLLAFSRRQVLQPEVLDLNDMVKRIERMLRRLIGEHIDLITALAPELGRVKADPGQLEQVTMNLAINARDAMLQGGKLIIETANVESDENYTHQYPEVTPGPYVLLAVSDTGTGMDEETRLRVFEPFFTTKEVGKGTGLGLAMSYGIIKQSGGHIVVYSELGRGTTFKVYLPRVDEVATPSESLAVSVDESYRGSETVLVVEDEVGVRELIGRVLAQKGYILLQAGDGPQALHLCQQHAGRVHLLLTDIVMPGGMNGHELATRLQSLYPGLKTIYMSGYTDQVVIHHGMLGPGTAFLQKPFIPTSLARKVFEVLHTP